jgi:hypothetical protein
LNTIYGGGNSKYEDGYVLIYLSLLFLCPESDVADFDGRSSLLYRFNQKLMSTLKDVISLKFKSMQGDGVLFHGEGQRGDHITLELQKGSLSLYLNLGKSGSAHSLSMSGNGELLFAQSHRNTY